MGVDGIGVVTDGLAIVSATDALSSPAIQTMSPAFTDSAGTRSAPSKRNSFVKRPVSFTSPFKLKARTASFMDAVPCITLPVRHLPKN